MSQKNVEIVRKALTRLNETVSVIRWHLRAQSGVQLDEVEDWVTWIRDGKIARIEVYGSKEEALEAAALRE